MARVRDPMGIAASSSGNVNVADTENDRIQQFYQMLGQVESLILYQKKIPGCFG